MATIRAYTAIEQSKKLAEFLPLDTADQCFINDGTTIKAEINSYAVAMKLWKEHYIEIIPCWSLAALLDVLESEIDGDEGETYQLNIEKDGTWWNVWYCEQYDEANPIETNSTEELIDACYEMIIKLHELNLL